MLKSVQKLPQFVQFFYYCRKGVILEKLFAERENVQFIDILTIENTIRTRV